MKYILQIQKLDVDIRRLKASIKRSKEFKVMNECNAVMKEGRAMISSMEKEAEKIIAEYNKISNQYSNLDGKTDILKKQKVEKSSSDNILQLIDTANGLTGNLAQLEQRGKALSERANKLLNDYNNAMMNFKSTKEKLAKAKDAVSKMEEETTPKIEAIKNQIKELEPKANKELLEKYNSMKEDNIFPVFVNLDGNKCAGCRMELSLNFIERLKAKSMMPCEECHRIILADKD